MHRGSGPASSDAAGGSTRFQGVATDASAPFRSIQARSATPNARIRPSFAGYPRFLRTSVCAMAEKLDKSTPESTWAKILSAQDYQVLREKGTERAGECGAGMAWRRARPRRFCRTRTSSGAGKAGRPGHRGEMNASPLAGTGKLNKFYEEGLYKCKGCGQPLYASAMKFDSGCGWPAFDRELPGAVER